jgi:hypothetical protein
MYHPVDREASGIAKSYISHSTNLASIEEGGYIDEQSTLVPTAGARYSASLYRGAQLRSVFLPGLYLVELLSGRTVVAAINGRISGFGAGNWVQVDLAASPGRGLTHRYTSRIWGAGDYTSSPTPEPMTMSLIGTGLTGLLFLRRFRGCTD